VDIVVPLRSRRLKRALILQKLNHAVPTVGLIASGVQALGQGAERFGLALAIVEILTSAFLIVTLARTIRAARAPAALSHHGSHGGVDWVDIWAAGVLFVEAGERWHLHHHLARPIILTALLTLALGLAHARVESFRRGRRAMRLTADSIRIPGKPFRSFDAAWAEIAAIEVNNASAQIRTHAGRVRRLDLLDLENADEVRTAFAEAQRRIESC
jgi:hypothetical protein